MRIRKRIGPRAALDPQSRSFRWRGLSKVRLQANEAPDKPRINGPSIYGAHPDHPSYTGFRQPARRPMQFFAAVFHRV